MKQPVSSQLGQQADKKEVQVEGEYYDKLAAEFAAVIRELSSKPQNLRNLESYLGVHFEAWLRSWASTPEGLIEELQMFASLKLGDD